MRETIFDIAERSIDVSSDAERIIQLYSEDEIIIKTKEAMTLYDYVSKSCFDSWSGRNHFIDLEDFACAIDLSSIEQLARFGNAESFIILIEFVLNLMYMAMKDSKLGIHTDENKYGLLKKIIEDDLSRMNHKQCVIDDLVYVVEDKPAVTLAAESVGQDLAVDIIKYNHYSLKGDLNAKGAILFKMGKRLEASRNALNGMNSSVEECVFRCLNVLNIRHNNVENEQENKKYKAFVAKMEPEELEKWYDDVYGLMTLALIEVDNCDRKKRVKDLLKQIEGGNYGQTQTALSQQG